MLSYTNAIGLHVGVQEFEAWLVESSKNLFQVWPLAPGLLAQKGRQVPDEMVESQVDKLNDHHTGVELVSTSVPAFTEPLAGCRARFAQGRARVAVNATCSCSGRLLDWGRPLFQAGVKSAGLALTGRNSVGSELISWLRRCRASSCDGHCNFILQTD